MASDFGGHLPEGDVKDGDDQERRGQAGGVRQRRVGVGELPEERLEEVGESRLADPAETQAGQGDADLAGRQVDVEPPGDLLRPGGRPVPLPREFLEPRVADLHDGEFGGDEEGVQGHQEECQQQGGGGIHRADCGAGGGGTQGGGPAGRPTFPGGEKPPAPPGHRDRVGPARVWFSLSFPGGAG